MNYQNGKVYRLDCLVTGECYIGSTNEKTLALRLGKHVASYKHWKDGKANYMTSYLIIERGNYQITLIEAYPCNSRDELTAREGHFIRTMECVNKVIAGRTPAGYYNDNKEKILEKNAQYRVENKEKIKEVQAEWRADNKEKIKEKDAEYRLTHKEELAKLGKEWYEANKELCLQRAHQQRIDHKDVITVQKKEWYEQHKKDISETGKKKYETNKEKIKARVRKYYEANKEKINAKRRKVQDLT